ncbi:hypothetical protein Micbo1qcDRAFT_1817 [Microdochium bolleyi]|uniref:Uncharacterized protein n=1 Tax=Microdochium bolleyi TaxID=196109 RepID=A0A136JHH1_9PEZI|nr:hypothetical protein Micbo1qcDRAFT_1817 [Microdochium bolleyi]
MYFQPFISTNTQRILLLPILQYLILSSLSVPPRLQIARRQASSMTVLPPLPLGFINCGRDFSRGLSYAVQMYRLPGSCRA